ncbi:MAG: TRAM domain-containing protein [Armatimonadota bacterium]
MGMRFLQFLFSGFFAVSGGLFGMAMTDWYKQLPIFSTPGVAGYPLGEKAFTIIVTLAFMLVGALLGFLIGSMLFRRISDIGKRLRRIPAEDKVASTFGTLLALIPVFLLGAVIVYSSIDSISVKIAMILLESVLFIWLGNVIALSMKDEMKFLVPAGAGRPAPDSFASSDIEATGASIKLLDTNVVIDGRIYDICRSGFLDGTLILPGFVIEELQHIADSADALRRNRGRRGLDILHQMQTDLDNTLRVVDRYKVAFAPTDGVDIKLVKLAKGLGNADIVTNDFNLNKVAKLHGVRVLNINELANAVKPVVLPGEELNVTIVREGKEYNQGVGYLDDGTMVVVENGKKMLGDTVPVSVSSVLQTVAGKMIFAELKYEEGQEESDEHNGSTSGRGNRRKTPY